MWYTKSYNISVQWDEHFNWSTEQPDHPNQPSPYECSVFVKSLRTDVYVFETDPTVDTSANITKETPMA